MLNTHTLDTTSALQFNQESHPSKLFAAMSLQDRMSDETLHSFFVHVEAHHSSTESDLLKEVGKHSHVDITKYIPHNTFVVHTTHDKAAKIQKLDGVLWVGNVHPQHKHTLELFNTNDAAGQPRPRKLIVHMARHYESRKHLDNLRKTWLHRIPEHMKISSHIATTDRMIFHGDSEETLVHLIDFLSHEPEVHHIERGYTRFLQNKWSRTVIQNDINTIPEYTNSPSGALSFDTILNGMDQFVGVADSGVDYRSCFFTDFTTVDAPEPPFKEWSPTATDSDMISMRDLRRRKIVQYVTFADDNDDNVFLDGHGTHVSGSVLGYPATGTSSPFFEFSGMAYNAKLAFFDIGPDVGAGLALPDELGDQFLGWAYAAGARIHSNSWGANTPLYTSEAVDFDAFMYNNKDMVVLVAAGNSGACSDSLFTVGSPSTSKNCIAVGATLNTRASWDGLLDFQNYGANLNEDSMASFSSQGPTQDNRLKPDVTAPGFFISSAMNEQTEGSFCGDNHIGSGIRLQAGTSQATPTVAGNLAIVRQYFTSGMYPSGSPREQNAFTPSGSMMKAMIVNSADEMSGVKVATPDECASPGAFELFKRPYWTHGYGRASLNKILYVEDAPQLAVPRFTHIASLDPSNEVEFYDRPIQYNVTHTYNYCVFPVSEAESQEKDREIRITLAWTDPPSTLFTPRALINDLDLSATFEPFGDQVFLGNAGSDLLSSISETEDHINNIEGIYFDGILEPQLKQQLTINVYGNEINVGSAQSYTLIVSGSIAEGMCEDVNAPATAALAIEGAEVCCNIGVGTDDFVNEDEPPPGLSAFVIGVIVVAIIAGIAGLMVLGQKFYQRQANNDLAQPFNVN